MPDTVTKPTPLHPVPEMSMFGYIIAAFIALILLPLFPFAVLIWLVSKVSGSSD